MVVPLQKALIFRAFLHKKTYFLQNSKTKRIIYGKIIGYQKGGIMMEAHVKNRGKALGLSCLFQASIHTIVLLSTIYFLINKIFFNFKIDAGYFEFAFGTDYFTLFFFLLISILGLFVSIYSSGYLVEYQNEKHFNVFLILYNLFALSLYLVVGARDIVSFLLFWELMSLTSYFLVIFEGHKEETLKSGLMYFVMTHIGTVFIILAFFMLYKNTGSIYFSDFYKYSFNDKTLLAILLLAFTGFGTKAGIVPLHVWLPKAHPAAPTNVSSLMSGVMIKMGIYGIIRFSFEFSSSYILSFGFILLAIGCLSAIIGITHALVQKDIKKFLAYSSIENVGIIVLALGISYICFAFGLKGTGSIAFAAALVHILNHGIFKGMLFMGAGNLLHSTGTKNIEVLGGLIKKMPKTSIFFLIGALAACAVPPFNGFIGEWLIYKSVVQAGTQFGSILYSAPIFLSGAALAFTGALAAYGFVKTYGIAFLGLPRSEEAQNAKEVP
jgi:hydrogenase-4 component B